MISKDKGSAKSYIIVIVILLVAVVFMLLLLNMVKKDRKAKPMRDLSNTTSVLDENTTTNLVVDNNSENNNIAEIEKEPVSNFDASLKDIIKGINFFENYDITTYYHGVEFTFKCNSYNVENSTCLEGGALMKVEDALFPLFTYTNESDNFLLRGTDLYIMLRDDRVYVVDNNAGVSSGSIRVFDRQGANITTIKNVLMAYKHNNQLLDRLYPNIEDGNLYYYACDNNTVVINMVSLDNFKRIQQLETVEGVCY